MLNSFISYLFSLGLSLVARWGYVGLIVGSALSSMLVPIPSSATLGFSGYLVSTDTFNFNIAILCSALGNLIGSTLTYGISRYFGLNLLLKYGKYIGITEKKITSSSAFIERYGEMSIFVSQVMPIIGSIISVPAGILKLNYIKFAIYTFSGGAIWAALMIYIGNKLGENWIYISTKIEPYENGLKVILISFVIVFLTRKGYKLYNRIRFA